MNTATHDVDVMIVGGGPVGITLAMLLHREGLSFRIVDARPEPIGVTHACVLWSRTQELLDDIGILSRWNDVSIRMDEMTIAMYGHDRATIRYAGSHSRHDRPLLVGQNVTERIILGYLAELGITVERPVRATSFAQDPGGATVELTHADGRREDVRTRWVAACEGSSSMVRDTLGISFDGHRYEGIEFVQADCGVRWSRKKDSGLYCFRPERFLGVVPLPLPIEDEKRIRVFIARPDRDPADRSDPSLEEIEAEMQAITGERVELAHPIWLNRVRVQRRLAGAFRSGRAFLVGDSGHVHVPMGGQGMNTGMQDAYNLAWKLGAVARGEAGDALLDTYEFERRPVAERVLAATERSFLTFIRQPLPFRVLAPRVLPIALARGGVQNAIRANLGQTAISYRESSIATTNGDAPALLVAGKRAPYLTLEAGASDPLALARGAGWTAIAFCAQPGESGHARAVLQRVALGRDLALHVVAGEGASAPALRLDPAHARSLKLKRAWAILIRPDGYIGYSGPLADEAGLHAYATRVATATAVPA
jgi:2-polyprenyl-6-methoxyphenol hydroxylase-like FAD-dependent oxidoreductase